MRTKAVLRIQDLNPMLFNYVEELSQIKVSKLSVESLSLSLSHSSGTQYSYRLWTIPTIVHELNYF